MTKPHPVRLDDLIRYVKTENPGDDPLQRLSGAVQVSAHVGEVADHLIGHFVDQARRAGASWTDIGRHMGVSKQAAQQRFVPKQTEDPVTSGKRFSRLTSRARTAIARAHEEARRHGHAVVDTGHVLLALLDDPESIACLAVVRLGADLGRAREAAAEVLGPPAEPGSPEQIPLGSAATKVLELAVREALRLGHDHVGSEHILLGLLRDERSAGARALVGLGITRKRAEEAIMSLLSAADRPKQG
ncbi:Clp protease N-terminal domain-containing protein [Allonocardiopsis opalescens]|uniref:ClpA/ClpB-like protein n=1 Tax=Allonocardiopsis opalescens TaxID=1144618 RepID=A0A2T0Q015_9ACTN|nr:Clp protease N-terminal domain-containing protein [Allonocardiopsis opalescens]PRX97141.1 ClpA/ClpB-like protein [Allonocardiopsis opalescens]